MISGAPATCACAALSSVFGGLDFTIGVYALWQREGCSDSGVMRRTSPDAKKKHGFSTAGVELPQPQFFTPSLDKQGQHPPQLL